MLLISGAWFPTYPTVLDQVISGRVPVYSAVFTPIQWTVTARLAISGAAAASEPALAKQMNNKSGVSYTAFNMKSVWSFLHLYTPKVNGESLRKIILQPANCILLISMVNLVLEVVL